MYLNSDLFNDLKQNEDETKESLTKGLEDIDPYIKQISTRPTGVEVRGQSTYTGDNTPTPTALTLSTASEGVSAKLALLFSAAMTLILLL